MRRFWIPLGALSLGLTVSVPAHAGDHPNSGNSSGSHSNKASMQSNSDKPAMQSHTDKQWMQKHTSSKPYGTHYDKKDFRYTYQCRSSRYGCDCYWYPADRCWCMWYPPWGCYVPYSRYEILMRPVAVTPAVAPGTAVMVAPASPPPLPDGPPPQP